MPFPMIMKLLYENNLKAKKQMIICKLIMQHVILQAYSCAMHKENRKKISPLAQGKDNSEF